MNAQAWGGWKRANLKEGIDYKHQLITNHCCDDPLDVTSKKPSRADLP